MHNDCNIFRNYISRSMRPAVQAFELWDRSSASYYDKQLW